MWRKFAMVLVLFAASSPVYAFPVIFGTLSNGAILLALSILGLGGDRNDGSIFKKTTALFAIIIVFLAYDLNLNKELSNLAQEHEYFSERAAPKPPVDTFLIPMDEAKKIVKDKDLDYIIISESKTPSINGNSLTYFRDENKLKSYAKSEQNELFLFSKYRNNAIEASNLIRKHTSKPVYIVDSGFVAIPESKTNFSEKSIFANYKSTSHFFSDYNVVTLGDNNALKTYFVHNSKLITTLDALLMSKDKWALMKDGFDSKKPLLINSSAPLNPRDAENISGIIANGLGYSSVEYSYSHDAEMAFTLLPNDNQIVPAHFKSTSRMSSTQIYGFQQAKGEITILCFSQSCMERIPGNNSSVKSKLIDTREVFEFNNGSLKIKTDSFSKNENLIIASNDSASSLLSYHLAKELVDKEFKFQGFTNTVEGLFGAAYEISSVKDTSEKFYFDSPMVRISTFLNATYYSLVPDNGLSIEKSTLIALGVLFGALISLGGYYSLLSSGISLLIVIAFPDVFKMESLHYQSMTFSPFLLASLLAFVSMRIMVEDREFTSWKMIFTYFSVSFFISTVLMHFVSPPLDAFYGGLLISLAIIKSLQISFGKRLKIIGTKYRKTAPFIKGHKGYIATKNTKINILKLLVSFKWIVRSNHLSDEEDAGGVFDSKICNIFNVNKTIKELKSDLKGKIDSQNIQFWVMPYVEFNKTGVASSHDFESPFSFSYSIDRPGYVTNGTSNSYNKVHRKEKMSKIEKKILKALTRVEKYHSQSVVIEFGIKRGNVYILQVKPLNRQHSSHEKLILEKWRECYKEAKRVEDISISPLSRSFVSKLYSYSVIFDENSAYRTKNTNKQFDLADARTVFNSLKESHRNIAQLLSHCRLYGLTRILSEQISPVANVVCSDAFVGSETELGLLQREIYKYMSDHGILPKSFEISDDWYKGDVVVNFSERDLSKSLVLLAFGLLKICHDRSDEKLNIKLSLSSSIDGLSEDHEIKGIESEKENSSWTIVEGELPNKVVHVDNISKLDKAYWKKTTLIGESIPPGQIGLIKEFGGVVSKYGSPLCHLALSAKFYNIPCRIGPVHYTEKRQN